MKFLKTLKAKFMAFLGLAAIGSSNAMAAVTVDPTTGVLSGNIDTAMYSSGIPIVIGFIAFTLGVTAVISLLRKAR